MKLQLAFFFITIPFFVHAQKEGSKIDAQISKPPAEIANDNALRLQQAPQAVKNEIARFNSAARTNGFTYQIGYTSVWNAPLQQITGFNPEVIRSKPAQPVASNLNNLTPRDLRVHISATASDRRADMRDFGIITPVRHQGNCGSCWAFGTIAALETAYLLRNGGDAASLDLSEQQLLNCVWPNGCSGGAHHLSVFYICFHKIATENEYPYSGTHLGCPNEQSLRTPYQATSWSWLGDPVLGGGSTTAQIKDAIVRCGSVICSMGATENFKHYQQGVYNANDAGVTPNHVIQLIGWDDDKNAWLMKNSWGTGWGEGGFGWVQYNTNLIGAYATCVTAASAAAVATAPAAPRWQDINYETAATEALEGLVQYNTFYRLQGMLHQLVIDLDDPLVNIGNANAGKRVQQWSSHGPIAGGSDGHNQEWWFIPAGKRGNKPVYKIFNNGFMNFITDNNTGKPVCLNGNGSDNQLWYLVPSNLENCFFLKNVSTGKCIGEPVSGREGSDLTLTVQNTNDNDNVNIHQKFRLLKQPTPFTAENFAGRFIALTPTHAADRALDVTGGNTQNGTGLQLWQLSNGNANQHFTLASDNGMYTLKPRIASTKNVEVYGISMDNGARITMWESWNGKNQQWVIVPCSRQNGKYIFFNRNSGKCLDVSNAGRNNGTVVQQWEFVNADNQKWRMVIAN